MLHWLVVLVAILIVILAFSFYARAEGVSQRIWRLILAAVLTVIFTVAFFFYASTQRVLERTGPQPPPMGDLVLPPVRKRLTVPDAAAVQSYVKREMEPTGYPVRVVSVELEQSKDAADKINMILSEIAFPDVHGRRFRRIVSLSRRCDPHEPCGNQVVAPSQLGWKEEDIADYRRRLERLLMDEIKPRDDDLIFRVNWATDNNERFTTHLLASKESQPRFETMLYLSPIKKRCSEKHTRGAQAAALSWDGEIINGFGMSVVTWKGNVIYNYQDGKLLTGDFCPHKSCLSWTTKLLWEVDGDATMVATDPVPDSQPDEKILSYQLVWSVWFPTKVNVDDKVGIEMPPPKGNIVAGSFSIRGDGTWNKM